MSINLAKNNFTCKVSENVGFFLQKNIDQKKIEVLIDRLIKVFDSHYFQCIFYRKHRDLMIVSCFYKMILQDVKINKKFVDIYKFSNFLKSGIKYVDFDKIQLFFLQKDTTIACLEKEVSFLKTFQKFFEEIQGLYPMISEISAFYIKMKKIENLSDNSIISKLTESQDIKNMILSFVGKLKNYEEISINIKLLNSLRAEFEMALL